MSCAVVLKGSGVDPPVQSLLTGTFTAVDIIGSAYVHQVDAVDVGRTGTQMFDELDCRLRAHPQVPGEMPCYPVCQIN